MSRPLSQSLCYSLRYPLHLPAPAFCHSVSVSPSALIQLSTNFNALPCVMELCSATRESRMASASPKAEPSLTDIAIPISLTIFCTIRGHFDLAACWAPGISLEVHARWSDIVAGVVLARTSLTQVKVSYCARTILKPRKYTCPFLRTLGQRWVQMRCSSLLQTLSWRGHSGKSYTLRSNSCRDQACSHVSTPIHRSDRRVEQVLPGCAELWCKYTSIRLLRPP